MSEEPREPLDPNVIADLRELAGDDDGFLREMAELFLTSTSQKVPAIDSALRAGRLPEVASHSHQLKSACGNLGALPLAEAFTRLETAALSGDAAGSATAFDAILRLLPAVEAALKKLT